MQFRKNRIVRTFFGYAIIILIPMGFLVYQEITFLDTDKKKIETQVMSRLQKVGSQFSSRLNREWLLFLSEENLRSFQQYLPKVQADQSDFRTDSERSASLEDRTSQLYRLDATGTTTKGRADSGSIKPDDFVRNTIVGYFQYDPQKDVITAPYTRPASSLTTFSGHHEAINNYYQFLEERLAPFLFNSLDLEMGVPLQPSDLKNRLRSRMITNNYHTVEDLVQYEDYYEELVREKQENVRVQTFIFAHRLFTMAREGVDFMVHFRVVIFNNERIYLQGFLINMALFRDEAQSQISAYQPEYGEIQVQKKIKDLESGPLFHPFTQLHMNYDPGPPEKYLATWNHHRNRLIFIISALLVILGGTMIHLGYLIHGNILLDRKKDNFISAITHELKTPLTSIIMYAEMLEEGWVKGRESTYYRHIHSESERLSRLIKNILDFSGLERGVFKIQKSSLLLHSFIEETLEPLRVWVENNNLTLDLKFSATPYIVADKDSLSQVLYNLCDNTIKYGLREEGDSVLTILVEETDDRAQIYVYDNGTGIPKKEEDKVFNRFYRCENEATREKTGTGLGLALVKELVQGNDGTIDLFRPQAGGFGVLITLPKVVLDSSLVSQPTPVPSGQDD